MPDVNSFHPRVCGGNLLWRALCTAVYLPSPRMRGKPDPDVACRTSIPSIPAYAGETYYGGLCAPLFIFHPRVCGGNQILTLHAGRQFLPSPRMRGKPTMAGSVHRCLPSIPAYAGETAFVGERELLITFHLRVCGGKLRWRRQWRSP